MNTIEPSAYNKIHSILDKDWLIDKALSFGLIIKSKKTLKITCIIKILPHEQYPAFVTSDLWDFYFDDLPDKFEIIWHPFWLQEILRWFELKNKDWQLTINWLRVWIELWYVETIKFDLSKPLQSQDLQPLLELMENIINQK